MCYMEGIGEIYACWLHGNDRR